jgi:ABC-type transporter Mla MlaB component
MGYKTDCKAKDLDYKSDDSWDCGVFATLSGENEKEFKDRMLHNVDRIRGSLANIETDIAEIQQVTSAGAAR